MYQVTAGEIIPLKLCKAASQVLTKIHQVTSSGVARHRDQAEEARDKND